MSAATYPPKKLVSVEILTREIGFSGPQKIVSDINNLLNLNTKFDAEYYDSLANPPSASADFVDSLKKILHKHTQRASGMEFHALVQALSGKDTIPRVEDAVLLKAGLGKALDIMQEVIKLKGKSTNEENRRYLEMFLQRWIYKFCHNVFVAENIHEQLVKMFQKEQKKEKEAFKDLMAIVTHLSTQHGTPSCVAAGYDPTNFRRWYVVLSNLLLAYFAREVSIPFNLQKIFIEFQRNTFFNYDDLKGDGEALQRERKSLVISPDDVKPFFMQFKRIKSPMKKSVLLGLLVDPERKLVIENFCNLAIKGVADMYSFIGKNVEKMSEAQGRDWLINVYDTIKEVVAEKKITEDTKIPEDIRKVFGEVKSLPTPEFRKQPEKKGIALPPAMAERMKAAQENIAAAPAATPSPAPSAPPEPSPAPDSQAIEVQPEIIDIPNLVSAQNLEELRDKGNAKSVVIVQDANVLEQVVQNWEIRGSLTFPELIEFARIPFQVLQNQAPGIREGRKVVSFAYLIALGLDQEHVEKFVEKLSDVKQITEERADQLKRLYPQALEQIGDLKNLNRDARPLVDKRGHITPNLFHEKCEDLRKSFMENFSYVQSLLSYWGIVEEMFYSIARGVAVMGNVVEPTQDQIEQFVTSRNDEYMTSYDKALNFSGPLKNFFKKKYNPELQKHFVNVKIKNDLIQMSNVTPVNLMER